MVPIKKQSKERQKIKLRNVIYELWDKHYEYESRVIMSFEIKPEHELWKYLNAEQVNEFKFNKTKFTGPQQF